jgi:DNA-binding response OmpR family regulator
VQFLFEQCAMDIERRELARDSEQVPIGPQVFDLLVYLLQNRERVVTEGQRDSGEGQNLIRTVARYCARGFPGA